jgi:hypothetical protein
MLALLAACGGESEPAPKLPAGLAADLALTSDAVAGRLDANDTCGAQAVARQLQADAIAAVNARRVPQHFQEELLGSVTALVESITCPGAADGSAEEARDLAKWLRESAS